MGRILGCLICDDIRQEITNKYILIGVYLGDMVLPEFPVHASISLWIQYRPDHVGEHEIALRFNGPSPEEGKLEPFATLKARASVDRLDDVAIPLHKMVFKADRPGEISVEFSEDEKNWLEICKLRLVKGEVQSVGFTPPPPSSAPSNL